MKVLVVGGAGYIGGAVTDLLAESEHEQRVFDCLMYEESYRKTVDFVYGDIRDVDALKHQFQWADAVVWLAALVGDGACQLNPDITFELNQHCVERLAENFNGRIIFVSTCSVYGAQKGLLDESSPVNPLSLYAATKLAAESYLQDKNALTYRLGTVFGVGDLHSRIRLDLVVNMMTVRAALDGEITVFGGDQHRPLLHVKDVAHAILSQLTTSNTGIFNLHATNVEISALAERLRDHFPELDIHHVDAMVEDTRDYQVSSERAKNELGFSPRYSVDEGIEEMKILVESGRLKDIENPRHVNQAFLAKHSHHMHY